MRILIAVDSIVTLDLLLNEITARSWPGGTEAHVLSVVEDGEVPLETWRAEGYGVAAVRHEMRRRGKSITAMAVDRLGAIGISSKITVMRGNPGFLISFTAKKWSADLILIRSHNRIDFRNWMLGSVAKAIVETAPCSVEVVRSSGKEEPVATNAGTRILVATDGSDVSLAASRSVVETVWPANTEVKVLSVVNPMTYSLEEMGFFLDKETGRAHRAIGEAMNVLRATPYKLSGEVIAGRAARQIIERARQWHADLIVMGTNQRRGLRRILFGSAAAAVSSRAHCSVRTIRGRGDSRIEGVLRLRSVPSVQNVGRVHRIEESGKWRRAA